MGEDRMEGATVIGRLTSGRDGQESVQLWHQLAAASTTVLIVVLGLLAAACGGGSSSSSSTSTSASGGSSTAVEASYTNTVNTKSAHMALAIGISEPGQAAVNLTGTGAVSFATDDSEFSLVIPQAGTFQVRLVGGKLYLMLPAQARAATGGKPWAAVDVSSLEPDNSTVPGLGSSSSDPSQVLGYLQGISSSNTNLGSATIRGVQTTHYRVVVDLNKAAQASPKAAAGYQKIISELHTSTLPIDVWTDSSDRVNQMQFQIPVPANQGGALAGGNVNFRMQLYDFGVPVTVAAPPADQVGTVNIPTTTTTTP
jgi:hypothetical protein